MASVEVFADVVCPFAYAGLSRLLARRHELGRDDVRFRIRAWPLELINGEPVDGHHIGDEVTEIKRQVAPDLFTGFDVEQFPQSSLPALALTSVAYDVGDAVGESVAMELRRLLFEAGQNVADTDVLADVALRHGVPQLGDSEDVRREWASGQSHGVIGSPHFFVDGQSLFCPVLDIRHVNGALKVKVDEPAYDAFVARCFG